METICAVLLTVIFLLMVFLILKVIVDKIIIHIKKCQKINRINKRYRNSRYAFK